MNSGHWHWQLSSGHLPHPVLSWQCPEHSQECDFKYPDLNNPKAFDGGCVELRHMSHPGCQKSVIASWKLSEYSTSWTVVEGRKQTRKSLVNYSPCLPQVYPELSACTRDTDRGSQAYSVPVQCLDKEVPVGAKQNQRNQESIMDSGQVRP